MYALSWLQVSYDARRVPVRSSTVSMKILSNSKTASFFLLFATLMACGRGKDNNADSFPENFSTLDDASKVSFVMKHASPDSVARFLCDASLGKVPQGKIDTLAIAVAYAYENYADSALMVFSQEFDDYSSNLPLDQKMRIYSMAGTSDPQRLGYELGLEYVSHIRANRMSVADIRKELEAFKRACANDSDTYRRFIKGFKTVLKVDHGKDLPEEVYKSFIDY